MSSSSFRRAYIVLPVLLMLGAGACVWVSRANVDDGGTAGDGPSYQGHLSDDGRYVTFESDASNLVGDDTNRARDVFVHDRETGTTTRVSTGADGEQGDGPSSSPSISDDGRYVAFESDASNLDRLDTNGATDVFVHDRRTGSTSRISNVEPAPDEAGAARSEAPSISGDGRHVLFRSTGDLGAGGASGGSQIYVHDRQTGATEAIPGTFTDHQDDSRHASISDDGRYVAFSGTEPPPVDGEVDERDRLYVHDRRTGGTSAVSVDSAGVEADASSSAPTISGDGRYVAFTSHASNLVSGDTNGQQDVFVRDLVSGTTERVTFDDMDQPSWQISGLSISDDGRYVACNFAERDEQTTNAAAAYLHDRTSSTTTTFWSSGHALEVGEQSRRRVVVTSISGNGRYVTLETRAADLIPGDTNDAADVFVRDAVVPTVTAVDPDTAERGTSVSLTISGSGFHPDTTVSFGVAIDVTSAKALDETTIRADITVYDGAMPGWRDVRITNPGAFGPGSGATNLCTSCFSVE
jgi:Tol biopolymer transport system component